MRKLFFLAAGISSLLLFSSCQADDSDLIPLQSVNNGEYQGVLYEGRNYWPYAVVSKKEIGKTIGYRDGQKDDRIGQYLDYPTQEWLVSWLVQDGGAMLLREENSTSVIPGIEQEYFPEE